MIAAARFATEKTVFRPVLPTHPQAGSSPEKMMAQYQDYRSQWKDPRWQKRRLEIMERAKWECENCGDKETTLNVHHKRYIKGRKVWEYDDHLLVCLCEPCHEEEHEGRETLLMVVADAGPGSINRIVGLVCGFLDAECAIDPSLGYMGKEADLMHYELGVAASALEWLGIEAWRAPVRKIVSEKSSPAPTMSVMVQEWDEKKY